MNTHSEIVDMMPLVKAAQCIKTESEVTNLRHASRFTSWNFGRIVEYIEDILESEKEVKHTKIQKHIEQVLEDEGILSKFTKLHPNIDSNLLDIPLPVLVQSGTTLTLNKF